MISLEEDNMETLLKKLNVGKQGRVDDQLGVGYCVDSIEKT